MIVRPYIKAFEKLGFGMFVHFGAYSLIGCGEWSKHLCKMPDEEYDSYVRQFNPKPTWATELAQTAKKAGCKYVTLTTRHHDGFSLYDTCGLTDYDTAHTCGRDLVREFVDACRKEDIIPFFYHTLLDWYDPADKPDFPSYNKDFPAYLKYLRKSVEILCTNYGKIGGIWFDGMWAKKPNEVWEEDALYSLIRKHQPEAMIINNTGLSALGALGHIELDSVTFERGKPRLINTETAPKYLASEMCEVLGRHWGYTQNDLNFKGPAEMIKELAMCRRYGCNMLMNVGPMGDGSLRPIEKAVFEMIGQWVAQFEEAIYLPRPCGIAMENREDDFLLKGPDAYYLFCHNLPMTSDPNVAKNEPAKFTDTFRLPEKIASVTWLDNGAPLEFTQADGVTTVHTTPFGYGQDLVVRVAKIICK